MFFTVFCVYSYLEAQPLAQNRRRSCLREDFLNSKHIVVYQYFEGIIFLLNHAFKMRITVLGFYNLYTRKR